MSSTAKTTGRLLAIGWDGVDFGMVQELIAAGRMPALASLRERGSTAQVRALPGLGDDGHWASFSIGSEPGVHGRFNYQQPALGSYGDIYVSRRRTTSRPFWEALDAAGHTVVVIDVPKSPIANLARGFEISDWMVHGEEGPSVLAHTAEMARQWEARWPTEPGFECNLAKSTEIELDEHCEALRQRRARRTRALEEILRSEPADLTLAVYAEGHCCGHHLWHRRGAVEEMLESLDADLARLLRAVDQRAVAVVVFGLTGMAPDNTAGDIVQEAVRRLDPTLLRRRPRLSKERVLRFLARRPLRDPEHRLEHVAYTLPHDSISTPIRINLSGREPRGLVRPGQHFAQVRDRLRDELLALTDADTGTPILTDVVVVAERYPGPRHDGFADLLACWDMNEPHRAAISPTVGRIDVEHPPRRSGEHREGGWLTGATPDGSVALPAELQVVELGALFSRLVG